MCKAVFVCLLAILVAVLITESSCKTILIIRPRNRPRPRIIIIRRIRETPNNEPLWLNQSDIPRAPATGDHPFLPNYIDDIKLDPNRRYTRSVDSPSAKRGGESHTLSGSDRHTGSTQPGYNRRQARDIRLPFIRRPHEPFDPFNPLPRPQRPFNPFPRPGPQPPFPIYV